MRRRDSRGRRTEAAHPPDLLDVRHDGPPGPVDGIAAVSEQAVASNRSPDESKVGSHEVGFS